jgi:hypothetical protein
MKEVNGYMVFSHHNYLIGEFETEEMVSISYRPTHRIEHNYYHNPRGIDSAGDPWWIIEIGE